MDYLIPVYIVVAFFCAFLYIECLSKYFSMNIKLNKTIPHGIIICQPDYSEEKPVIIKV